MSVFFPRALLVLALLCSGAQPAGANTTASYADHPDAQRFMDEMRDRHGFDAQALQAWFAQARHEARVIQYILPPPDPGVRSWQAYRARYVEPVRVGGGLRFWEEHDAALRAAREQFGVPEQIIVAIIGVETIYGRHTGNFQSLSALATLAFDYPPRADLFRRELEELLLLAREQGRDPGDFHGSYAGALGLPQFLPSSWRRYAVDFDGDGRIDLTNPVDAIGSVGNFLREHGWERDGEVAVAVDVRGDPQPLIDAGIAPRFLPEELSAGGMEFELPPPAGARGALVDLTTPDAPTEYWFGMQNFYTITRYNRSSFYAMAVYELSRVLRAARESSIL